MSRTPINPSGALPLASTRVFSNEDATTASPRPEDVFPWSNIYTEPGGPPPRRPPKLVRRLFIWGFIGANAAISIAWAYAADEAAAAGMTGTRSVFLRPSHVRAPGSLVYMVKNFGLSGRSLRQGRWWTLLTSGVSHIAPAHLIVNMCEFYTWASRCFDLGLGPGSVAGLMLGSAVCCSVAGLANEVPWWPTLHMGASGIISGLRVAAILLEPVMGFRVPVVCDVRYPLFITMMTGCAIDLNGMLSQRRELTAASVANGGVRDAHKTLVGYAGHLGGAAFGVIYWYLWLRSRFGTC
ncbi:hypothetical protein INS49_009619 [Diaporthe citri]|uniref:uncharacterized protein n=1 Tax=Diaporthe citri TaxID=83186 RepID=UPI001C8161E5|nr:uncharacterized protein INS49_009619 [Diaporthe citri]KAG6361392.1 hypothetical protein INS49_009619 [Diaporthe citri]